MTHRTVLVLSFLVSTFLFVPARVSAQTDTPRIAFGREHAVALRNNGDVVTWGANVGCQLGRRAGNWDATPGLVMRNVKEIAAASDHTLVLAADGKVYGWGTDGGAIGTGEYDQCEGPALVESLEDKVIAHIATGHDFSVAVTADGHVYCTGDNSMGQCPVAKGGSITAFAPVPIAELSGKVVAVAAGSFHTLALLRDGTVYAFGRGRDGQLGNGRAVNGQTAVSEITNVTAISAGTWHSAAVRNDGSVWLWGNNQKSQMCDGATVNRTVPTRVETLPAEVKAAGVAAGSHTTLIRAANGALYGCGDNQFGALGADKPPVVPKPALIASGTSVAGLAVGGYNGAFSLDGCAVRISGNNDRGVVAAGGNAASSPFVPRVNLSLCGARPATALATVVNPAPRGGNSGCWAPRVDEDAAANPKFAALRQAMIAAEDLLKKNTAFMAALVPVRYRSSLSAGPFEDGGARIHVKVVPERKIDGSRLWTGECGVIPQLDRIGGAISQISVFFNSDARGPMISPTGLGPKQTGTVAGYPEYNGWVLITKDGRLPWIPQTLADKLDAEGARRKEKFAEWNKTRAGMKSMDPAAMRKAYEAVKKTDPAGAEKMLADFKAQGEELARRQKDVYPLTTAALEKQVKDYETYRASFTAAQSCEPAVWGDTSGEGKRKLDAEIAALQRLSPEEQREMDTLNREKRAPEARAVASTPHGARVAADERCDRAVRLDEHQARTRRSRDGRQAGSDLPRSKQPSRIQAIAISFSRDPDAKQVERRAWQQKVKETFDFAALAAFIK